MNKIMGFLAGALCGAIVGSVSALLLAPMSGRELQSQARDRFEDIVDDARKAATDKRMQLEEQLEALKAPSKPVVEVGTPANR
ncbi:MAG: YtxH domain-containing protein [Anaerolineales bacterium]